MLLFAVVLLVLVCAPLVCAPGPAWAADDTATITAKVRVFQEYRVSVSGLENKFTYLIVPNEDDAPLPIDESGEAFDSFTLTRDEDDWLVFAVPVTVSPSAKAYSYHYTLKPATYELEDGLHYVDVQSTSLDVGVNVYYLELHVQPSSEDAASAIVTPLVHVDGWDGPKVSDPGWRVGYKAPQEKPSESSSSSSEASSASSSNSSSSESSSSSSASSSSSSSSESSSSSSASSSSNGSSESSNNRSSEGNSTSRSNSNSASNSSGNSSTATKYSTSSSTLAKTGDALTLWLAMVCIACVAALLLVCTCLFRRKTGEDDA